MITESTSQEQKIAIWAVDEFMRKGVRSVSMDDIASGLGMSKKTLYKFFQNKRDLVNKAIEYKTVIEKQLLNHISESSEDAIHEMVQLSEHIISHFSELAPSLIIDLQKHYKKGWEKVIQFQMETLKGRIQENLERGINENFYRHSLDTDIISKLYVSMCVLTDNDEVFPFKKYDRKHLIEQVIFYHLQGILTDQGRNKLKKFELFNSYHG